MIMRPRVLSFLVVVERLAMSWVLLVTVTITAVAAEIPAKAALRVNAEGVMSEAKRLQDLYRADPTKSQHLIAAALAFHQAQDLFAKAGLTDPQCDAQASLMWCRKQMNQPTTQAFQRRLAGEAEPSAPPAASESPAAEPAPLSPEEVAFGKAKEWVGHHPGDHQAIIRAWRTVSQSFPDTAKGLEAQGLAEAEQRRYEEGIRRGDIPVATRLNPLAPAPVGAGKPLPLEADLKRGQAELKKTLATLWSKRAPADRRKLIERLLAEADRRAEDPAVVVAALQEALRQAEEIDGYEAVLAAVERLSVYSGMDPQALVLASVRKMRGGTVTQAVIALVNNPQDKAANEVVGRYFAVNLGSWEDALPFWIHGADQELRSAAVADFLEPSTTQGMLEVGDAWFAIGKKRNERDLRIACFQRAQVWYEKVAPELSGEAAQRVSQRLAEIVKVVPLVMDRLNWSALTEAQWERLKGTEVTVELRVDRTQTGVVLKAGEQVRVVPHPKDRWTFRTTWTGEQTVGFRGLLDPGEGDGADGSAGRLRFGAFSMGLGNGNGQVPGLISGPGSLWFEPHRPGGVQSASGAIRVKIVPAQNE